MHHLSLAEKITLTLLVLAAMTLVIFGAAWLWRRLIDWQLACDHHKSWRVLDHDATREKPFHIECHDCRGRVWVDADHVGDADPTV